MRRSSIRAMGVFVGIVSCALGTWPHHGATAAGRLPNARRGRPSDRFRLFVADRHAWQISWPSGACREVEQPGPRTSSEVYPAPGGRPYALAGPPSSDGGTVYLYQLGRQPKMRMIGQAAFGPSWLNAEQIACPTFEGTRLVISVFDLTARKRSSVDLGLSKKTVDRDPVIIGPWLSAERRFLAARGRRLFTITRTGRWSPVARLPEPSFNGITALVADETGKRIAMEVHRTGWFTDVWVSTRGTAGLLRSAPLDLATKPEQDSPVWPSVGSFSPDASWLIIAGMRNAQNAAGYVYDFGSRKLRLVSEGGTPGPWLASREFLLDVKGAPPQLKVAALAPSGKIGIRTVRAGG